MNPQPIAAAEGRGSGEAARPRRGLPRPGDWIAAAVLAALPAFAPAQMPGGMSLDVRQEASSMQDRIGAVVPPDLELTDERGYPLSLRQYFPGDRPVILDLGYYGCPGLCGAVMNGMVDALNEVDLVPGEDYVILTVSIDPREKPDLARRKKDAYLGRFTVPGAAEGWRFAVGGQAAIAELTSTVGFRYYWAEHDNRFDHPPALIFLSPKGVVTRVLTGTVFDPGDVRLAIVEASEGRLGTFWDKVRLSCLTFDPVQGGYTVQALTVMKIGGAVTVIALAVMIVLMLRRERRRSAGATSTANATA